MRRQELQRYFPVLVKRSLQRLKVEYRFVNAHSLAPLKHHLVVNVKTLTPRDCSEGHKLFNADCERAVAAIFIRACECR